MCFCLLTLIYAKNCNLTKKSIWSRYGLVCETIRDVCPLHKKTPGVGGISSVIFKKDCPLSTKLEDFLIVIVIVLFAPDIAETSHMRTSQ